MTGLNRASDEGQIIPSLARSAMPYAPYIRVWNTRSPDDLENATDLIVLCCPVTQKIRQKEVSCGNHLLKESR
jgi:hypothetical protein